MKILIFGANGFVGPYLINEFLNSGYEVVASDIQDTLSSDGFRKGLFQGRSIGYKSVDIMSAEAVASLIQDVQPDGVVNLAAISSVGQSWSVPALTMDINVIGTLNILEALRKFPAKLLLIGSSEEYEMTENAISEDTPLDASNPYGVSKVAQEYFANIYRKNYGISIAYVRAFNHTGVGQRESFVLPSFCKQVAAVTKSGTSGTISVGNLNVYRDFSDVRDIVRGYRMIFESLEQTSSNSDTSDGKTSDRNALPVYNIGSGVAYNLSELLDYIISLSSEKILTRVEPSIYRPVDQLSIKADTTKIQTELGWKSVYSIYDTLKEMYDYYLSID